MTEFKTRMTKEDNRLSRGRRRAPLIRAAALIAACALLFCSCGESYIEGGKAPDKSAPQSTQSAAEPGAAQDKTSEGSTQDPAANKNSDASTQDSSSNKPADSAQSAPGGQPQGQDSKDIQPQGVSGSEPAGQGSAEQGGSSQSEGSDDAQESSAEPAPMYVEAPEGYFSEALFIGDSRCEGLRRYGGIEGADWFTDVGLTVFGADEKELEVEGIGTVTLPQLLEDNSYKAVYVCLGINELGFGTDAVAKGFSELVSLIREKQPDAVIYLLADLHVTAERSDSDPTFNNANIEALNTAISMLADFETVYYLDANPLFDDADGNMNKEYSFDNTHLYAKHYPAWADFLAKHTANRGTEPGGTL